MAAKSTKDLSGLLVKPPYRFDMGIKKGDGSFFKNHEPAGDLGLLQERQRSLDQTPELYSGATPGSEELLKLAWQLFHSLNAAQAASSDVMDSAESCRELGRRWEPDFLLLQRDEGDFRLLAGSVCFPSSWSLQEKLGHPLEVIHGPVPTLNRDLGTKMESFLSAMKPGVDWERLNWGLASTSERNLHPSLRRPRLSESATLEQVWLRIEHQALRALPLSGSFIFGIRIERVNLATLPPQGEMRTQLATLLETMPTDIAAYKGLTECRSGLIRQLRWNS